MSEHDDPDASSSASAEPSKPDRGRETDAPQTLTAFDWLDTIVDEMLIAADKTAARQPAQPSAVRSGLAALAATEFPDVPLQLSGPSVLGQVILGYSPMIDRHHAVIATRLTVVPRRPDIAIDAGALLRAVGEVWPAGGGAVSLNVASETLLADLLRTQPTTNVMIEVPAFLAAEPANVDAVLELAARGNTLLIRGRPLRELPRELLRCFKWSIVDLADDRRVGQPRSASGHIRTIPHVQSGVRSMAQVRECFERGAVAVLGWPIDEPITNNVQARPDLQVLVEMINRIDRGEPVEALERTLVRDPVLAFELMRHGNAPSIGLRVETHSFRDAITLLGYPRLRRWLAGLLAAAGDANALRPVNFAALRRGLFLNQLAATSGDDETRGELFMCGVFSLLDQICAKPISDLLKTLVVPERVRQALVDQEGPFFPLLELVRAVESEVPGDIRAAADAVFVEPLEINRSLLRALAIAANLE